MEKKTNEGLNALRFFIGVLVIGFILWLLNKTKSRGTEPYVTTRKALAKTYEVDLKTFNKWVQIFADPAILDYVAFSKQRGITQKQSDYLVSLFGSPTEGKTKYSKADIVSLDDDELHPNEYTAVRESLKAFPDRHNITSEIYTQLNLFPPRIGRELKKGIGA